MKNFRILPKTENQTNIFETVSSSATTKTGMISSRAKIPSFLKKLPRIFVYIYLYALQLHWAHGLYHMVNHMVYIYQYYYYIIYIYIYNIYIYIYILYIYNIYIQYIYIYIYIYIYRNTEKMHIIMETEPCL